MSASSGDEALSADPVTPADEALPGKQLGELSQRRRRTTADNAEPAEGASAPRRRRRAASTDAPAEEAAAAQPDAQEPLPRRRRRSRAETDEQGEPATSATATDAAPPRRRGRPSKRDTAASPPATPIDVVDAQTDTSDPVDATPSVDDVLPQAAAGIDGEIAVAPKPRKRRGRRPRGADVPAATPAPDSTPTPASPTAPASQPMAESPAQVPDDPAFQQLARLWRDLHPQARRALVIYASNLCAEEAAGEG